MSKERCPVCNNSVETGPVTVDDETMRVTTCECGAMLRKIEEGLPLQVVGYRINPEAAR